MIKLNTVPFQSADKGKAGAKAAAGGKKGGDRQKSAGKGGKDKGKGGAGGADVPPAPRKETKLRKRGEEDDDSKYIGSFLLLSP